MKSVIKFLFVFSVIGAAFTSNAQISEKEAQKLDKKQRKETKKQELKENLVDIKDQVRERDLLLDVTMIRGRYGSIANVVGPNFIKVEGDEVTLQTSAPTGLGRNGLGGITVKGLITDYNINEKGSSVSVIIQFSSGLLGHSTINLSTNASGVANALVTTNYGERATFSGNLTLDDQEPYEGMTLF